MPELEAILELAGLARRQAEDVCLVTVAGVQGSSYRKPGARMLLTGSGRRAGTISGGCLEGEVSKKAWWLTEKGPSLQRYSSFFDEDAGVAYGLGCGGTVSLLLERGPAAEAVLDALRLTVEQRRPVAVITELNESSPGTRLVMDAAGEVLFTGSEWSALARPALERPALERPALERLARETLAGGSTNCLLGREGALHAALFCERIVPPQALWIFGAGDDVQPLVEFAYDLGWHVTVADGRSNLARLERFPHARRALALTPQNSANLAEEIGPDDAVVLMTHSYEQDRGLLARLLSKPLGYLGILGPRSRTVHILGQILEQPGQPGSGTVRMTLDEALARLHSPVGLNLSAHTPAAIALSIAAEVQAALADRVAEASPRPIASISSDVH